MAPRENQNQTSVDLDALVASVERRVLERIAAALSAPLKPAVVSTRRGRGPAGWSDERAKKVLPTIPGAYKSGRWTIVPMAAFERWEASQATTPPLPAPAANDASVEERWSPRAALESVGLRRTR